MQSGETIQQAEISTGISVFKCIRDASNTILDLEWVQYFPVTENVELGEYLVGKRFLQEFKSVTSRILFRKYVLVGDSGEPMDFVCFDENEEGRRWYQITVVKREDGLIVNCNDITKFKESEQALKQNEEQYKFLLENSSDLICRTDLQARFLYASPVSEKLIGYRAEELLGKSFMEYVHPDDLKEVQEVYESFIQKPFLVTLQMRFMTKGGIYKWIEATASPIEDEEGNVVEVQSSTRDISESKALEEELRKREEQFRFMTENSSDIIVRTDKEGRYIYVSPASRRMLGYEPDELIGKSFMQFIHQDELPEINKSYPEFQKSTDTATVVSRFKTKDGGYKWLEVSSSLIKDEYGDKAGVQSSIRDITERKLAEEKIRLLNQELEERVKRRTVEFSAVLHNTPIIFWSIDKNKVVNRAEGKGLDLLGMPQGEGVGKSIYDFFKDYPEVIQYIERALKGESFTVMPAYEGRHYHEYYFPMKDEYGEIKGMAAVATDITDEKNAQLEAQVAKERLISVVNNIPVVFWAVDKKGMLTLSEGKSLEDLGTKPGELNGQSAFLIYQDYPDILDNISRALNGEEFNVTMKVAHVHFQGYYSPIKDENGEITGMAGISLDITDRVKAEEALVASEAKYKAMAEGIPQLVWTARPDGEIDYYNSNWYKYTGLPSGEDVETAWQQVVHPDDLPGALNKWLECIKSGKDFVYQIRIMRASDGLFRWHLVKAWPARNEQGEIIKWLGTCTDVHDQKEQNEELQVKNRELVRTNNDLDNFVYTASHDLKAPISNIEGLFMAIGDEATEDCEEDIHMMLKMAGESLQRLKLTIGELTEISQIQRNINEDVDLIDIDEVVRELLAEQQEEIKLHQIVVEKDLQVPTIAFSRKNFRSMIYNLLSNAIKFRDPDRRLQIHISTEMVNESCMRLSVADTGIGFEPENKEKIFKMFKRLHTHVEGTGVGLYLVKRIMENSGGRIEAESEPGKGTTFRLYFNISSTP